MKIYSWNMLYRNPDFDRAYSFIENLDFDILCLQEVPDHFLQRLNALPAQIVSCIDSERINRDGSTFRIHCAILSKNPIATTNQIVFPDPPRPLRTRIFAWVMRPQGWHVLTNRHGLSADVATPVGSMRVFSLHLSLTHPSLRRAEFDSAMHALDPVLPTAVCGDFNILESPRVTLLNWILGGRLSDIFSWHSERAHIEERFKELGLHNPLRGRTTQTISKSQLDHILVSDTIHVKNAFVLPDRYGSDHHPVFIETEA